VPLQISPGDAKTHARRARNKGKCSPRRFRAKRRETLAVAYQKRYNVAMRADFILAVRFYRNPAGGEPVRDWLLELAPGDRKTIGTDIKTVQYGWPLGMPLVRKMERDLWELRIHLENRIARVLFTVEAGTLALCTVSSKSPRERRGAIWNWPGRGLEI
jgi:hypothetical protein